MSWNFDKYTNDMLLREYMFTREFLEERQKPGSRWNEGVTKVLERKVQDMETVLRERGITREIADG